MLGIIRVISITVFFLAYPYLVYRGMDSGMVWLAPAVFSGIYVFQAFNSTKQRLKIIKLTSAALLLFGALFLQSITAKLMPIFIQLLLMHFFGRTLFKGTPLIERFVRFDYPELPVEVVIYARQLTVLWTGFFALNALICGVLAIWASDAWWAFYSGILIFVLTGMLMVGEYIYRHFRFPGREIPSIRCSLKNMMINGRSIWAEAHE